LLRHARWSTPGLELHVHPGVTRQGEHRGRRAYGAITGAGGPQRRPYRWWTECL